MVDTLLVIDSYLSSEDRYQSCKNLIGQLREVFTDHKILLINKHKDSYGIEESVDYYLYFGDGFMVGRPPQHLLDSQRYEMPYTYVDTHLGTCENWFPLVGVTDHVANIYNSFVLSSNIARTLGYDKVFKVEYDTSFNDVNELDRIKKDVSSFKDYLFYGTRKEGEWAKTHQYLVDVHMIGYSNKVFQGFNILKNDDDFWALCESIGYYGKWIEYIVPSILEFQRKNHHLEGIDFPVRVAELFPGTIFDTINSPGEWASSWEINPKICRIGKRSDSHEISGKIVLFYWGNDDQPIKSFVKITNDSGVTIFTRECEVHPRTWHLDEIDVNEPLNITVTTVRSDRAIEVTKQVTPDTMSIPARFLYN